MKFQRIFQKLCLASGLILMAQGLQPAYAESFSFRLNGLGITENSNGDRTLSGSLSLDGEKMLESEQIDFDLTHGDRGDSQSLEMGLNHQGESILNAVFDLFGLNSGEKRQTFDANVSGDINPTHRQIDLSLGDNMPGMSVLINTPKAELD